MTDRTTTTRRAEPAGTTAPDATSIEEAMLRIKVAANIVETIAEALRGQGERLADTLILMAGDLEASIETIKPVVPYLMRRDAA